MRQCRSVMSVLAALGISGLALISLSVAEVKPEEGEAAPPAKDYSAGFKKFYELGVPDA